MKEQRESPSLVRRPTKALSVVFDSDAPTQRRVVAGVASVAVPVGSVFGAMEGIHLLGGVDPSLAHAITQHLAITGGTMEHIAPSLGVWTVWGALHAYNARHGDPSSPQRYHPSNLQRPVYGVVKTVRNVSSVVTIGGVAAAGGMEVAQALGASGLGSIIHTSGDVASASVGVAILAAGLTKLWGVGARKAQAPKGLGEA